MPPRNININSTVIKKTPVRSRVSVETHLCKLCVLRSRVLRVLYRITQEEIQSVYEKGKFEAA